MSTEFIERFTRGALRLTSVSLEERCARRASLRDLREKIQIEPLELLHPTKPETV